MYYEIGDVCQKVINVDGFDFKLAVKKKDHSILVNILDLEDKFIDGINITNEKTIYTQH
ncbi:putative phi PVL-like protein [Staphylococcus aureus]|uniref:Putative phi PVL-like protein n=1 Tax=Staphylococcus aureus TaxID=1280 RepID=A0A8G2I0Z0_STAAU|nr:putative phi PVL-like protein [Staphylococcus aureus]